MNAHVVLLYMPIVGMLLLTVAAVVHGLLLDGAENAELLRLGSPGTPSRWRPRRPEDPRL